MAIATAAVRIVPDLTGIHKETKKGLLGAQKEYSKAGKEGGSTLASAFGGIAKTSLIAAGGLAAGGFGLALTKGFGRLKAVDDAEAKLRGLGYTATDIDGIMGNVSTSVEGTSFLMGDAASVAAGSLAAGIKPGKDLTSTLSLIADAASFAGTDMNTMGGIFNKVASTGKLQGDTLDQLGENGIPIVSMLSETLGVSSEEVYNLASAGKIGFGDFQKAMESGMGGAAQEQAKTFSGAFSNTMAAIGRFGEALLKGIFPQLQPMFVGLIDNLNSLTEKAAPLGQMLGQGFSFFLGIMQKIIASFSTWTPILATVVAGLTAYWVIQKAIIVGTIAWTVAQKAWKIATAGATVQMRLLNAAMRANPIGIIITALVLLVAGFILAYKKIEWFRNGVNAAWVGIKTAVNAAVSWFQRVAWPVMQMVFARLAANAQWLYVNAIAPAWAGIQKVVKIVVAWFQAYVAPVIQKVMNVLGTVFTWLYRNVVIPVFKGIQLYIKVWWTVVEAIFVVVVWTVKNIVAPIFMWLWKNIIVPVFKGIGAVIKAAWIVVKAIFDGIVWTVKNVLAPIFTWLYNRIIKPVWNGIKWTISTAWAGIKVIWNAIVAFINTWLVPRFRFLRDTIKSVWARIQAYIHVAWAFILDRIFKPLVQWVAVNIVDRFLYMQHRITVTWNLIKAHLRNGYLWIKNRVFDPLSNFITKTIPNAFETGVAAVARAWDSLKAAAKKPVNFLIETVYNDGIVKLWNPIAELVGKDDWKLDTVPKLATGGKVWGPGTETSDSVPAMLSRNEHVLSARDVRNLGGHGSVYQLRAAAAKGWVPALASGGTLSDAARWLQSKNARITEFGAWGQRVGTHSKGSYHYKGEAFDANYGPGGQNSTEMSFFDGILGEFHKKFPDLRTIWRAPGHFNHLHVDIGSGGQVGSGGSSGGSIWDLIPGLGAFRDLKDKVKNMASGPFGEAVGALATKGINGMVDLAKTAKDWLGNQVDNVKSVVTSGVGRARGKAWATAQGWPLSGKRWEALDYIVSHESSWNKKAKNPSSTASGLGQMINSTARAYLGGSPMSRFPFDDQLAAIVRYTGERYGGLVEAMRFWKRNRYYRDGGAVTPVKYDNGGYLQPGLTTVLNATGKPEPVFTSEQFGAMNRPSAGISIGTIIAQDPDEAFRKLYLRKKQEEALYIYP